MSHDLAQLSPDQLTARLYELRHQERHILVEFLLYLGEVERRRLHLELGYRSLFAFLAGFLGYSEASAYRRFTAARLLARFPLLADYLADGRLHLTNLVALRDVLDEEHLEEILSRAAGRTEEEVKRLVAALQPRPAAPDLVRRLPAPPAAPATAPTPAVPPAPAPSRPARVEPISETQHILRATVSEAFVRDLEAVRAALGHKVPGAGLEAVLHECLRVTLAACHKRRRGAGKTSPPANDNQGAAPPGRHVPAAVRDAVWLRDEGRCAFVGSDGHRCGSTYQLELHHRLAFARGGAATVENLTLRCKAHNDHEARRDFGDDHIDAAIAGARHTRAPASDRQGSLF